MNSVPNIVFDLDGTLVDSAPSLCKAGNHLLEAIGRQHIDVETYKMFIGRGLVKQVEQLLVYTGGIPENGFDDQYKLFRKFYDADPIASTKLYDGVPGVLKALKARPSKLAICTQKMEKPARMVLSGLNLEQYFDGFAFGDSIDVMKPDPKMVMHSIRNFHEGALIYVGDSETDSLTAKNSGAIFLLYSGGYRNCNVDQIDHYAIFEHHAEIPSLVNRILKDEL